MIEQTRPPVSRGRGVPERVWERRRVFAPFIARFLEQRERRAGRQAMDYRHRRPDSPCSRCGCDAWTYDGRLLQEWRCCVCSAYRQPEQPCQPCQRCGHPVWVYNAKTHHWFCERAACHDSSFASQGERKAHLTVVKEITHDL